MLWLYRRVIFGKLDKADLKNILDLSPREVAIFAPLVLLILWMGVYPSRPSSRSWPRRSTGWSAAITQRSSSAARRIWRASHRR